MLRIAGFLGRLTTIIAIAALIIGAVNRQAFAQTPMAIDFDDAFAPDFARRDVPTFKQALALDDEQTSIIDAMVLDYHEQFNAALQIVREDLKPAQAVMGFADPAVDEEREAIREEIAAVFEKMQAELSSLPEGANANEIRTKYEGQMKDLQARLQQLQVAPTPTADIAKILDDASLRLERWRSEKSTLRNTFIGNVQTILREDQQPRWPALERRLRRERSIGRGLLQGEGVDLVLLATSIQMDDTQRASLASILSDYEAALDSALQARDDLIARSERAIFQAVQRSDSAALAGAIERITQARVVVRNVNDDFAMRLSAAAGSEGEGAGSGGGGAGTAIMQGYRQRGYPLVFRDTQTMRLIKAAQQMPALTPAQSQALEQAKATYEAELAPMNERVLAAVREHEPARVTLRESRRILPPTAEQEEQERDRPIDGVQKAFDERAELGRKYDSQVQAILGEELYERLPRNQGSRSWDGGRDAGGSADN